MKYEYVKLWSKQRVIMNIKTEIHRFRESEYRETENKDSENKESEIEDSEIQRKQLDNT